MNWQGGFRKEPRNEDGDSFQFWYRAIVLTLLPTILSLLCAGVWMVWGQSVRSAEQTVVMAGVQSDVATLRAQLADVPTMRVELARLKQGDDDISRRMDVLEGHRSFARDPESH